MSFAGSWVFLAQEGEGRKDSQSRALCVPEDFLISAAVELLLEGSPGLGGSPLGDASQRLRPCTGRGRCYFTVRGRPNFPASAAQLCLDSVLSSLEEAGSLQARAKPRGLQSADRPQNTSGRRELSSQQLAGSAVIAPPAWLAVLELEENTGIYILFYSVLQLQLIAGKLQTGRGESRLQTTL